MGRSGFKFYMAYRKTPGAAPEDDRNDLTDGLIVEIPAGMAPYQGTLGLDRLCTITLALVTTC
jgi:hypothetical protein